MREKVEVKGFLDFTCGGNGETGRSVLSMYALAGLMVVMGPFVGSNYIPVRVTTI